MNNNKDNNNNIISNSTQYNNGDHMVDKNKCLYLHRIWKDNKATTDSQKIIIIILPITTIRVHPKKYELTTIGLTHTATSFSL